MNRIENGSTINGKPRRSAASAARTSESMSCNGAPTRIGVAPVSSAMSRLLSSRAQQEIRAGLGAAPQFVGICGVDADTAPG